MRNKPGYNITKGQLIICLQTKKGYLEDFFYEDDEVYKLTNYHLHEINDENIDEVKEILNYDLIERKDEE